MAARILVLDNYDSFVFNLVQYLGELGADPLVHRSDALSIEQIEELAPDGVLISPGPGRPEDAGLSNEVITNFAGRVPVFGVCLGHHKGVFAGLPDPFEATRYHSLVVQRDSVPECLEITAQTQDGLVMGLRHREFDVEGVQFHPESILTAGGHQLVGNFLERCGH
ncbi:MAG: aminodeoxychorismate/anthranilate synthase component II [Actinobacteria bacterium]|nr:aminodeoxychorismate/anthranilate synthase component II [Actinomycetota bacterium]